MKKKINFARKLNLNKEVISNLNQKTIFGGEDLAFTKTIRKSCINTNCDCPPLATQEGYPSCNLSCVDHSICPGNSCMC